jgi:hypothetical protein
MAGWDGMGGFSFTYNWTNDAANNIDINAGRMDTQFANAVSGFDNCLTRDGQGSATANLPMNTFKFTGLGAGSASNDSVNYSQLTSATAGLTGFLSGLTLSTAGSSSTFGIAAGSAVDSTSALFMNLPSAFTKTTGSFSSGTGNGALDASTIANSTWYHVFLIGAPGVSTDILISLSPTSPTLPGGFTLFRRIGSMKTDSPSAHWILFTQRGNEFLWGVQTQDAANVVPANSNAVLASLTVPSGIQVNALFIFNTGYNSTVDYWLITSPDQTDTAPTPTSGTGIFTVFVVSTTSSIWLPLNIRTNTSSQIRLRASQAPGNPTSGYRLQTIGWVDTRGQG